MYTNRQQGSAHIIFISVLAVVLIGALGFLFWTNVVQPKSVEPTKDSVATKSAQATTSSSPSASPKPDDSNSLILSEWNVRFTVPESLRQTSVKYAQSSQNGQSGYGFTTSRIESLGGDCATQPYGKTVVLKRSTTRPQGMDGYVLVNEQPINNYYYAISETVPACSGDAQMRVNPTEIADTTSLTDLLKTLKSTK